MALASDANIVVNAIQLGPGMSLDDVVRYAKATGSPVFVGVAVPARLRKRFVREIDDALADVVGRLGPRLTAFGRASASSRAEERRSSGPSRDRPGAHARRRR
jgi:hypothetical protein